MDAFSPTRKAHAAQMGRQINAQRERVFRESPDQFAQRLSEASGLCVSPETVLSLERGDESLPFQLWMGAFSIMQVADAVAQAVRIDAALFLAASAGNQPAGIQEEILKNIPKKD